MKYTNIAPNEFNKEMLEQLRKGIFMTTKKGDKVNTMTIGWGGINVIWYKYVFIAYVRYSRDTYEMLENNDEFTISVPLTKDLKQELAYCGTKSGRDTNKIKDCNLSVVPGRTTNTPVIGDCDLHYECKVIYRQAMEPSQITQAVKDKYYTTHNYHVVYYGEIVDSYQTKGE